MTSAILTPGVTSLGLPSEVLTAVSARHRALSALSSRVAVSSRHRALSGSAVAVSSRHRALSGSAVAVSSRHRALSALTSRIAAHHRALSAMPARDRISARHRAHCSMSDTETRVLELPVYLIHAGRRIEAEDVPNLSCDDGASTWSATINLDDPSEFARLRVGDPLTLRLGALDVALIVDSLQRSRAESPTYQISALSPVARYRSPYAASIALGASGMARAVCERLLEQSIDWRLPDWRLPDSAAELEDTPLALAQQIVSAVGGRLESQLDGALIARPATPVSVPMYAVADALHLGDDQLYAYSAQIDAPLIANRFVITAGDDAESDADQIHVEAIADADDPHAYTVRAYPTPWRPVELVHTGDSATAISARAEIQTTHAEQLEIVAGSARTRYPVHAIDATRWQYADLGAVRLSDAQTLAAGGAESYSLLNIEYRARAWEWRVTNARTETIQFLAVE